MSNYKPIDRLNSRKNLKLFNSFSKSKELFKPRDESSVKWYNCGPTVYDVSHMGHARCFISFDIIRRVLKDYFKFNVKFVQNVTDIDDKIIKRARQNYLWNQFVEKFDQESVKLKVEFECAKNQHKIKLENEQDLDKKAMLAKQLDEANQMNELTNLEQFTKYAKDVYLEYLDKTRGESVTDNSIFAELPRKFEEDFYTDMKLLNVLRPDHAPRVSEFVKEIIAFIEKIIENGFAYKSESGSVYFNTVAFNNHTLHKYGKLAPEAIGDQTALNEGEGALSVSDKTVNEKLNKNDFALWKASKAGEPSWSSSWGLGRPGWHIECSTMACSLLGEYADIHSGGIDLRFPHHENEIAQTESYFNTGKDWISYFLHTGHLHIEGCKMSKSLKNFISIKEALNENSSRLIRLAFLLHSWEDSLDYSRKTIQEAQAYEKAFKEFFFLVEHELRNFNIQSGDQRVIWSESETKLDNEFIKYTKLIDDYLCDNINTKGCLIALTSLVSSVNVYYKEKGGHEIEIDLLKQIAFYITEMLRIFGVIEQDVEIGFGSTLIELNEKLIQKITDPYKNVCNDFKQKVCELVKEIESKELEKSVEKLADTLSTLKVDDQVAKKISKKEIIYPYVKCVCDFRESIRMQVKDVKSKETKVKLLTLCDELRDYVLPQVGVEIDDKIVNGQISTLIKLDDDQLSKSEEVLRKEVEDKKQAKEAEALEKERKKEELAKQQAAKEMLKKIPPSEWFKRETDKYLKFDDMGIPTHLVDKNLPEGKVINDSQRKNLLKQYKEQEKKYSNYLKSIK